MSAHPAQKRERRRFVRELPADFIAVAVPHADFVTGEGCVRLGFIGGYEEGDGVVDGSRQTVKLEDISLAFF